MSFKLSLVIVVAACIFAGLWSARISNGILNPWRTYEQRKVEDIVIQNAEVEFRSRENPKILVSIKNNSRFAVDYCWIKIGVTRGSFVVGEFSVYCNARIEPGVIEAEIVKPATQEEYLLIGRLFRETSPPGEEAEFILSASVESAFAYSY